MCKSNRIFTPKQGWVGLFACTQKDNNYARHLCIRSIGEALIYEIEGERTVAVDWITCEQTPVCGHQNKKMSNKK